MSDTCGLCDQFATHEDPFGGDDLCHDCFPPTLERWNELSPEAEDLTASDYVKSRHVETHEDGTRSCYETVRCPHCLSVHDAGNLGHVQDEGIHKVGCENCGNDFEFATWVTRVYQSPKAGA